jgi:hypothetical protein
MIIFFNYLLVSVTGMWCFVREVQTGCGNAIQKNFRLQKANLKQEGSNIAINREHKT